MFKFLSLFCFWFSFSTSLALAEGEKPINLFQIDFDLSPSSAKEVIETRFGCVFSNNYFDKDKCYLNNTLLVTIGQEANRLSRVKFNCNAFEGCAYTQQEVIEGLASQKGLVFDHEGSCATGELGEQVCVDSDRTISMHRMKFRKKALSFD